MEENDMNNSNQNMINPVSPPKKLPSPLSFGGRGFLRSSIESSVKTHSKICINHEIEKMVG